jgi:hypothetical protein
LGRALPLRGFIPNTHHDGEIVVDVPVIEESILAPGAVQTLVTLEALRGRGAYPKLRRSVPEDINVHHDLFDERVSTRPWWVCCARQFFSEQIYSNYHMNLDVAGIIRIGEKEEAANWGGLP